MWISHFINLQHNNFTSCSPQNQPECFICPIAQKVRWYLQCRGHDTQHNGILTWPFLCLMEQHIFCIFIDYRGRHWKGVSVYNVIRINLQPKPLLHRTNNVFLNTTEWFKYKKSINCHYFCHEYIFLMTFSELPPIFSC